MSRVNLQRGVPAVLVAAGALVLVATPVLSQELCIYTSSAGAVVQVNGFDKVPEDKRSSAKCFKQSSKAPPAAQVQPEYAPLRADPGRIEPPLQRPPPSGQGLAAPQEIELEGNIRKAELNSALGVIELRWPRSVERLFGRTPERAMVEAAQTVSKALRQGSFPPQLQKLRLSWQVVFMDQEPPPGQVPANLRNKCHPGWMTPPANIYVVAQRVVGKCQGKSAATSVADAELTQLLVHEIGHAVEHYLLQGRGPREPMRAEGFATWFESYASDFSSLIPRGSVARAHKARARSAMQRQSLWQFQYSGEDYSRASMYFFGVVDRYNLSGLLRVYERIPSENISYHDAVQREFVIRNQEVENLALKAAGLR